MQTFFKPRDKRWVDLAIWCDENAYKPDCDDNTLYQYLYLLFWMLSHKWKSFRKESDYDEYCLMGAQTVFMRLKNPKQFDGSGKLQPVKSVLNYIKNVAYPIMVSFQKQTFAQAFDAHDDLQTALKIQHNMAQKVIHSTDDSMRFEFRNALNSITKSIKNLVDELPYRKDKLTSHNIYISCLLTILNYLRLDKIKSSRLNYRESRGMNNEYVINEMYQDCRYQKALLYHLPDDMSNFISTIVNRALNLLAEDLVGILGSYEPSDAIIKSVLASPLADHPEEGNE